MSSDLEQMEKDLTQDQWTNWSADLADLAMRTIPKGANQLHVAAALINAAMMHIHMMDMDNQFGEGGGVEKVKELQNLMMLQFEALDTVEIQLVDVSEGQMLQ